MAKRSRVRRKRVYLLGALLLVFAALLLHLWLEGRPPQGRAQYVAMGSSFAAGPAITQAAADSPWFCARSRDNYAHQLARQRGLSLVDVSCGGATTRHILAGGQLMQPPQIDAVTADTELVTVTIGGNDIAYLGQLMAMGCDESTSWLLHRIGACRVRSAEEMQQALRILRGQLSAIAAELRRRAPRAQRVFVTYQTVLPDSGTCERLGLDEQEAMQMRAIAAELAEVTRQAAEANDMQLLDAAQLTRGHDVCAAAPWMNGLHPPGGLLAAPLHPTLEGMAAVADGLDRLLERDIGHQRLIILNN